MSTWLTDVLQTPTSLSAPAASKVFLEDEVRLDDEHGDMFFIQPHSQLLRVLEAACVEPTLRG